VESGRHLVCDSGTLLAGVSNMSGLGRLLPVEVRLGPGTETEQVTLAGPLCAPGDLLGRRVRVPPLAEGDLVTIPNAGAYRLTAGLLMFLGHHNRRRQQPLDHGILPPPVSAGLAARTKSAISRITCGAWALRKK
jgi:hypothetical protein